MVIPFLHNLHFVIDGSGKLGLGTAVPSQVLTVAGNISGSGTVFAHSEITSKAGIQINSGTTLLGGLYNSSGKVHLRGEGDRDVSIGSSNNADRVIIDTSTGDVEFTAANAEISG